MPIIAKVGITGGPAGGKTYFTSYSKQYFMKAGIRPVYVSEVATLFDEFGIGPTSKVLENIEYQYLVAKYQMSVEDTLINSLKKSNDKILLVFDRTLLDGKAYCSTEEWKIVLERLGVTEQDIYERYDIVLHFVSTAVGKYANYSTENNPARSENKEQAAFRENANVKAYNGMNIAKKICLNNDVQMDEKQSMAVNVVLGFLKMAQPIFKSQEKFLVRKISKEKLSAFSPKEINISQVYLNLRGDEAERRIRCITDNGCKSYYYTQKDENKVLCSDRQINFEEYYSLLKDKIKDSNAINKRRWYFSSFDLYFQYDEFEFWNEFAILEVQATNVYPKVKVPKEFEVISKITEVKALFNDSLANNIVSENDLKKVFNI